jgi:hypothetical protein
MERRRPAGPRKPARCRRSIQSGILKLLLLSAFGLLLSGCGVQGPPLPPLLEVPQPAEIQAVQRGPRIILSWLMPRQTSEGQALRPGRLGPANVYMAILPGLRAKVSPADFQAAARKIGSIAPSELQSGAVQYPVALPVERAGSTAAFAVTLANDRGRDAGFSNVAAIPIVSPPSPPPSLQARETKQAIVLEWPPVEGAAAYDLYRSVGGGPFELRATVPAGAHPVRLSDENFEIGKEYRYLVRAIRQQDAFRAESADSEIAAVKPAGVFPPATPTELVAVFSGGAIELSWEPSSETLLAGYSVYRRAGSGEWVRLTQQLAVSPAYRDADVRPGTSYSYAVTTVDQRGNESARSEPTTITP